MVRIAPVRLAYNPKTLWFDAGDLDLRVGDKVVVSTARGTEFGTIDKAVFDMDYEETKTLKSPLKPVRRKAAEEDIAQSDECLERSREALPVFKQLAAQYVPDMNPVAVEYLFDGDKAVFYFESEERVDFRELVRKLAAKLQVRVDMKQIGVRDEARMIGGLGHCGQELCCRRLGGGFDPVSIRMAKEQDLSLNPQKISGICGRLMCCLRYEYDAYKDFHSRAPKKNARIQTPDGEGKVVELNVPREIISVKVGDEKPVKVPLADMEPPEAGSTRPNAIGEEAWARANEPATLSVDSALNLFSSTLTGEDKLADPGKVRHVHGEGEKPKSRSRRRGSGRSAKTEASAPVQTQRKARRRSTTVKADGTSQVKNDQADQKKSPEAAAGQQKPSSSRRRRRSRSHAQTPQAEVQSKNVKVGRNSSSLRAGARDHDKPDAGAEQKQAGSSSSSRRRRRRSHRGGQGGQGSQGGAAQNTGSGPAAE